MIAEISAGVGSLNAAMSLLKGLNAIENQAAVNQVKLDLQEHIFKARESLAAAREAQSESLDRIRDLEQQIAQFEDWKAECQRYELKAIDTGAIAYMLKEGMESGEPAQWLCARCFEKRQKGRYNFAGQVSSQAGGRGMHAKWACDSCRHELTVYYTRKPSVPWAPKENET